MSDELVGAESFRPIMFRDVRLRFDDVLSFMREYDENISKGALFLPCEDEFSLGDLLEITLELAFCFRAVRVLGVVAQRISESTSIMLDREAGVLVKLADGLSDLQELIRDTFSNDPMDSAQSAGSEMLSGIQVNRRAAQRFQLSLPGHLRKGRNEVRAMTENVSDSGALLRISGMNLTPGEQVSLGLVNPKTGNLVVLAARVVRQEDEHPESKGVAVEFEGNPKKDRAGQSFLEQMRAISQARRSGGMSGNLSGLTLPALLQSLATSAARGTLDILWESMEAHILFEHGGLRYARLGKAHGIKALARLFEWRNGEFNYQPVIDADEPSEPIIPIAQAVIQAMHQVEELERLGAERLDPTVVVERTGHLCGYRLDETESQVLHFVDRPMCVEPVLDSLPEPDADLHKALLRLLSANLLRVRT